MLIKLLVERTGRPILSTLVISSRSIITKPNSDPYSDPYHGKTGRHALTSHKIYFSKKLGIAVLSGTWRDAPADGKIQYIPVRIPPSPPKMNLVLQRGQGSFIFTGTHVKKQHKCLSKQDCPTGPEDTLWDKFGSWSSFWAIGVYTVLGGGPR